MHNFNVNFTIPWLLLLLIPALFFTLFPYFRINKKYRRTRNRIISMILHMIVMVLCISVLAGITFSYDVANDANEIVILVDSSYSNSDSQNIKDDYITNVLDLAKADGSIYNIAIVAFGYNPVTVSEFTNDMDRLREDYFSFRDSEVAAELTGGDKLIDDTATDIAKALTYAETLITNKNTGKIILVSDGVETDGDAISAARVVAARGIKIDTVCFPNAIESEVQIIAVTFPEENIIRGVQTSLRVTIQSSVVGRVKLVLTDDADVPDDGKLPYVDVNLKRGLNEVKFPITFSKPDLHRLSFSVEDFEGTPDTISQNNKYNSYYYLQVFNKVLLLEGYRDEGMALEDMLTKNSNSVVTNDNLDSFEVTRYSINPTDGDFDKIPQTVDELREFDQVVLVNVSNSDLINTPYVTGWACNPNMPNNFDHMLKEYVEVYGGGLFVVGGDDPSQGKDQFGNPVSHAFNVEDMSRATAYKDLLPVEVTNYYPPIGLLLLIDSSGSMDTALENGASKLTIAEEGAKACLEALSPLDYIGVISFGGDFTVDVPMTSSLNKSFVENQIDKIKSKSNTVFTQAIDRAGQELVNCKDVRKRHCIIITDGQPADNMDREWGPMISKYSDLTDTPVTFSIVMVEKKEKSDMEYAARTLGHGEYFEFDLKKERQDFIDALSAQISSRAIRDEEVKPYHPIVTKRDSAVVKDVPLNDPKKIPELGGFYGTRNKEEADTILSAEFVPVYSQWKYGSGTVGAFMCSLNGGDWSSAFMADDVGEKIITNIVNNLMPATDIRSNPISVNLVEDNYSNKLSIYTNVEENEFVRVVVTTPPDDKNPNGDTITFEPSASEGYSRVVFEVRNPGVHRIVVQKVTGTGDEEKVTAYKIIYKTFSYSKEYNPFVDAEEVNEFMTILTANGRGTILDPNAYENVFMTVDTVLHKIYDPRMLFMILSIILVLLDIAVRKFKFKWLHEIIRDHREKKKFAQK